MRRSLWAVALVVVLGGFVGFQQYSSWSLNKSQVKEGAAPREGGEKSSGERGQGRAGGGQGKGGGGRNREAIPVLAATAIQKAVPVQLRAVGNAEPYATVSIKSQVTGVLQQAHFKEGQDVKKGQLLFTVDPRPLESALKQAEAALARDTAQLQNAREQARRYADLVEKQYVSREQYDQIRTNADALESTVAADKAAIDNAKVQLSYCYIYSPVNGRVGSLLINEGNLIRLNDGAALVVINQINPIYVSFSIPEQDLAELKRYSSAGTLKVDASFPSEAEPERGTLEFVDNAVDRSTGTIKLKAVFPNTNRRLWPGQFVNIVLTLTTQAAAVVIPSEAIQIGPEGQQVFVIKEDKRVEVRSVTVGQSSNGEVIVAKGLAAGEQVVKEGQFLLGPDSRVEIREPVKEGTIKGEGRRGRNKAGSEGKEAKGSSDTKGEATQVGAGKAAAVKDPAKSDEESKTGEKKGRRGRADGAAKTKSEQRGES